MAEALTECSKCKGRKMNLRVIVALIAGAIVGQFSFAREVTPQEAVRVAEAWCARNGALSGKIAHAGEPVAVASASGATLYWKVPMEEAGLLVVAGDTRLPPVIAAVPEAEGADIPAGHPLVDLLQADLSSRLAAVAPSSTARKAVSADVEEAAAEAEARWDDLLGERVLQTFALEASGHPARVYSFPYDWCQRRTTHWNQNNWNSFVSLPSGELYDRYTPNHYPAGCVAVAGAAVLHYFRVAQGPTGVTRACKVDGVTRNLTTLGGAYDWSLLPRKWLKGIELSEAAKELMGRVVYDVGVCVNMAYTANGSGAVTTMLADVLRNDFGLKSARAVYNVTPEHYEKLIYAQTRCEAPVVLSLSGNGGHAVLAVGYGEDDAGAPYTRIFMGWGGMDDAWYALPAVGGYTTINSVVTMVGPTADVVPVYGCATWGDGWGESCVPGRLGSVSFRTGVFGEYGRRASAEWLLGDRQVSVGGLSANIPIGTKAKEQTPIAAATLCPQLPGPIDFALSGEAPFRIHTDANEARAEALRTGKALFVLSGADWCGPTSSVKGQLRDMGTDFTERYVLYYCNIDTDTSGMAGGSPQYGAFDPRAFAPKKGWFGNAALAQDRGSYTNKVANVVAVGHAKLPRVTVRELRIVGPEAILSPTVYSAVALFSDGVEADVGESLVWGLASGTVADISEEGLLTPRATGDITVQVAGILWNQSVRANQSVSVVSEDDVRSLAIVAPNVVDLEDDPETCLTCTATLTDGRTIDILPTWSVVSTSVSSNNGVTSVEVEVDALGRLVPKTSRFYAATLRITAEACGKTATKTLTLYPVMRLWPAKWTLSPMVAYPGTVLRVSNVAFYAEVHGKPWQTVTDLSKAEVAVSAVDNTGWRYGYLYPLARDATPGTLALRFLARRTGSGSYTYLSGSDKTVTVKPLGVTLGSDKGSMPLGWISSYFPAANTEAKQRLKAEEDSDGDGFLNWEEYVAGTDPTDATSALRITSIIPKEGDVADITWEKIPGRVYTLLGKTSLSDPEWLPATAESRFFRVAVEME